MSKEEKQAPARPAKKKKRNQLRVCSVRLFDEDVDDLHRIAEDKGVSWQIELRLLVRRALKGEKREILVLKERP